MKLVKTLRGYKPLAVTEKSVFLGRGRRLFLADLDLNSIVPLVSLPMRRIRDRFSSVRIADRLMRLSITSMLVTPYGTAFVNTGSEIWRIDLETLEVSLDLAIPKGRKALALSRLQNVGGHDDAIIFGDYFANLDGPTLGSGEQTIGDGAVNVWIRPAVGPVDWRVLAQFPSGSVDHIHNVISSDDGQNVFTLVGDTGAGVGFWKWDPDLAHFKPFQTGQQVNRSTWAVVDNNKLVYATDTQLEQNYLLKSVLEPKGEPQVLQEIAGSSIYSARTPKGMLFSTSVEPGMPSGNFIRDTFERRVGPGINGCDAKIYHFDLEREILTELFSARKDLLPFRLGQFGSFMFPSGMERLEGRFYAYGNAVKRYDNVCLMFRGHMTPTNRVSEPFQPTLSSM